MDTATINNVIAMWEKTILQKQSENHSTMDLFNCSKCDNFGYIWEQANTLPRKCDCYKNLLNLKDKERMEEIFSNMYKNCTFDNFKATSDWQQE